MEHLEENNDTNVLLVRKYLYQKILIGYIKLRKIISCINKTTLNFQMSLAFIEIPYKNMSHELHVSLESFLPFLEIHDLVLL
jgi:hypothetical protein